MNGLNQFFIAIFWEIQCMQLILHWSMMHQVKLMPNSLNAVTDSGEPWFCSKQLNINRLTEAYILSSFLLENMCETEKGLGKTGLEKIQETWLTKNTSFKWWEACQQLNLWTCNTSSVLVVGVLGRGLTSLALLLIRESWTLKDFGVWSRQRYELLCKLRCKSLIKYVLWSICIAFIQKII